VAVSDSFLQPLCADLASSVTTNTIRNSVSARLSVPSIVRPADSDVSAHPYVWRTPLRSTAPFWAGWFTGLSSAFLTARAARLLILAGADRLDRELMIGQMQGKFQMAVVPGVGHMLHEVRCPLVQIKWTGDQ
jgi:protein phosphatase methylesterase 1